MVSYCFFFFILLFYMFYKEQQGRKCVFVTDLNQTH